MEYLKYKKTILSNLPIVVMFWFCNIVAKAYYSTTGTDFFKKLGFVFQNLVYVFKRPFPSFTLKHLLIGAAGACLLKLFIYTQSLKRKKYRNGEEHGSARFGTPEDIQPFIDKNKFSNNILLTKTERLTMGKPSHPKYARNKNGIVCGGSGSGKTRFLIKPNLMQMYGSYVVTDPKGTVVIECGKMLQANGYQIRIVNTINFAKSMHYNPFAYIKQEKDVLILVNTIIANTKGDGEKASEDFWVKAEKMLLTALIAYIYFEAPQEEQNFTTLLEMINAMEVREDDETFKNSVDLLFDALEKKDPAHFAVRQYQKYKLAAGKTAKSILISCGARLSPFDIAEVRQMMDYDELELDTIGDTKTALFLIMSDTDKTFDFIIAMIVSQMFNVLMAKADDVYGGSLPIPVQCLFDEAANITIPHLEKTISVCRSRNIGIIAVLQAISQYKAIYKDHCDTIIGNADFFLFLGGTEKTSLKETSELLGKQTIDLANTSENRGKEKTYGTSYQKLGRELMSIDELAVMDGGDCILRLRGVRPFLSKKFDITKHKQYKNLSDYSRKNAFDIEQHISCGLKLKAHENYTIYETTI